MGKFTVVALSLYAATAAAQAPSTPADPKIAAPAAATSQPTTPGRRDPTPSRNQFFSPVMGINIEGQGLTLPKGVAEEEPIAKPAAEPPAAPASAPTPK